MGQTCEWVEKKPCLVINVNVWSYRPNGSNGGDNTIRQYQLTLVVKSYVHRSEPEVDNCVAIK
ncbi:hypothetical protein HanHA89_Chr09g0336711 [Helianthus annuus]|nr:hypothetical protein HanHA89_Chr09g0336711 [Helianthus annuus]